MTHRCWLPPRKPIESARRAVAEAVLKTARMVPLVLLVASGWASAVCHDVVLDVHNATVAEARATKRALLNAQRFMTDVAACLPGRFPLRITFAPEVRSHGRAEVATDEPLVAGRYDAGAHEVSMTKMDSPWLFGTPYFGIPMTKELYTSLLTHEIVHALSRRMYGYTPEQSVQEEYVGYVAQFGSLSPATRRALAEKADVADSTWADASFVSGIFHAMAPHKFGTACWSHFTSPQGGRQFLTKIWTGAWRPAWDML